MSDERTENKRREHLKGGGGVKNMKFTLQEQMRGGKCDSQTTREKEV